MMYEDGNPTRSWFKKSFRDNDKYMSKLVNCNKIFIPMNDNDIHWYLCVVELIPNECIYILDSLPSTTKQDIQTKNVKIVVTGLDKLLSYLEKDNYTDSITKFALKPTLSNPIQNNGYDCGMYVIKHICTNIFNSHLPFLVIYFLEVITSFHIICLNFLITCLIICRRASWNVFNINWQQI
ncbi:hypothetical protein RGQ29_002733 [Quercus rubra]|uniref:Ubiquitin-like protease family profile domain-containing protein n=1 Tax=Quercus rubra TaxID=3512 RepID=A0AAN7E9N6_QUERU|nr:hypothetical protein RGQ29_002733 [Quercus rubra]